MNARRRTAIAMAAVMHSLAALIAVPFSSIVVDPRKTSEQTATVPLALVPMLPFFVPLRRYIVSGPAHGSTTG